MNSSNMRSVIVMDILGRDSGGETLWRWPRTVVSSSFISVVIQSINATKRNYFLTLIKH